MLDPKYQALCQFFKCTEEDITEEYHNTYSIESEPGEYLVLNDVEADDAINDYMECVIEEVIIPQIPKPLQMYFDRKSWKRDFLINNGRGCLSTYDNAENEELVDGHWYFIYRMS